jgi:hypothetical protein
LTVTRSQSRAQVTSSKSHNYTHATITIHRISVFLDGSVRKQVGTVHIPKRARFPPSGLRLPCDLKPASKDERNSRQGEIMASAKQKSAARKNVKKAAGAAKRKRTIAHLPKSVRTALGKQAASVAKKKRRSAR